MSLTRLLMAPIKLFKKDVITFLIIRRYDLGIIHENMHYIAVKPSASISVLRQKVWHLLDLPDYCEEIIILKSPGDIEIPLTELRRGNDPQHPYFLEVWAPRHQEANIMSKTMICYNNNEQTSENGTTETKGSLDKICNASQSTLSIDTMALNKLRVSNEDIKKSTLSSKFSKSSLFKVNSKKSQDSFVNVLMKIQSDLSTLADKLSVLENKIHV